LSLSAVVACSKKEEPAPAASTPTTVIMGAAPVFNVAPQTGVAAPATPEAAPAGAVATPAKTKTGVGGATATTTTASTTPAAAAAGGSPAAATTAAAAAGGTPAKATTAAAAAPQVDLAGCFTKCQARFSTCTTAAAGDLNKLAACQSVIPACQADCQAK
jgi:hypothetical protein